MYELTRLELLRDLYVWAYERSTHEYLAVKRDLASPDPIRLAYREAMRKVVQEVVTRPDEDSLTVIDDGVAALVGEADRQNVRATIIEELRRLHEGSLARYGLRASEFGRWRTSQRDGIRVCRQYTHHQSALTRRGMRAKARTPLVGPGPIARCSPF